MSIANLLVIASFTAPEVLGTKPSSLLWMLPLAASIAIIYKTTKLPTITPANFIREVLVLFGSIVLFITIIALALYTLAWLIAE